uniref:Odorant receptor n=1 Tax=Ceracris kiangsu TaxID=227354 RepID=A0A6M6DPC0_CERKI|nr:odorant receptor 89 [Ceracris kiangsu]
MERMQRAVEGRDGGGQPRALCGHVVYLAVAGLWPRARGALYVWHAALVQACAACYVALGLASVHSARGDVDAISHTLMHTLEVVSGMVKAGLFFGKRRAFYRLVHDLHALVSADWERPELARARRRARRMTVSLSVYIYALILLWLPAPLLVAGERRLLPVVQIHGVDWSRRPGAYAALYTLQCVVLLTQVPVVIGLDCFFVAAMLHAGALLQLLGRRVSGLWLSGDAEAPVDGGYDTQQALYADLCGCIRTHQKITKFLRDLESAMSAMVLVQFSSNMVGLCMTLYQQTQIKTCLEMKSASLQIKDAYFQMKDACLQMKGMCSQIKDALTALQYALILPFYTGQLYFYCWTADVITEQGEALSSAAYSSGWVGSSAGFQRALSVVMARAHRPLVMTAGRLYPITTATFVALMKASYSYYTLLRQLDAD